MLVNVSESTCTCLGVLGELLLTEKSLIAYQLPVGSFVLLGSRGTQCFCKLGVSIFGSDELSSHLWRYLELSGTRQVDILQVFHPNDPSILPLDEITLCPLKRLDNTTLEALQQLIHFSGFIDCMISEEILHPSAILSINWLHTDISMRISSLVPPDGALYRLTPETTVKLQNKCDRTEMPLGLHNQLEILLRDPIGKWPVSIGVSGPQGSGKTFMLYETAKCFNIPIVKVEIGEIFSRPEKSASTAEILHLFGQSGRLPETTILLFDDFDRFSDAVFIDFIEKLNETLEKGRICDWIVPPEYPNSVIIVCMGQDIVKLPHLKHSIEISYPSMEERTALIESILSEHQWEFKFPSDFIEVAKRTQGMVAGDIEKLLMDSVTDTESRELCLSLIKARLWQSLPQSKPLDEFVGLENVIEYIDTVFISSLERAHPPRGILLHGEGGCGKTSLALAVTIDCIKKGLVSSFHFVDSSSLLSKLLGGSEKNLHGVFASTKSKGYSILILDQIESLASKRSHGTPGDLMDRLLSTLLTEMDGVGSEENKVIVIATTRDKKQLDPAILRPGRLDFHVEMENPNGLGRMSMLHGMASDEIIELTEGWSGADIEGLWREACMKCIEEGLEGSVEPRHVESAFIEVSKFHL